VGIEEVPFIYKPADVPAIRFGLQCNADGQLTAADDVFDLAELCWHLTKTTSAQDVADNIGISRVQVQRYKAIKEQLAPGSFSMARRGVPKNFVDGTKTVIALGTGNVPIGTQWNESHLRSLLAVLPYQKSEYGELSNQHQRNTMRAQAAAVIEILERFTNPDRKVTAGYCGEVGKKWAWFATLLKEGFDRLKKEVPLPDKKSVVKLVRQGKFGTTPDDLMMRKFVEHIDNLNKQVLRLWLVNGRAESMPFLPDGSVDVIVTSPPYNLGVGNWPMGGKGTKSRDGIEYADHSDDMAQEEYEAWQLKVLQEAYRVAKDGASFFYNHKVRISDGKMISPMRWLDHPGNPWILRQEIIWNRKSTHNHAESLFWPVDERIYWMTKGKPKITHPIGKPTIWEESGPTHDTWHPAPFTDKLPKMLLDAIHIAPSSVVLDPFAGSCTTIKVAIDYQCQAVGVDLTLDYLNRAVSENKWPEKCIYAASDLTIKFGEEQDKT